MNVTRGALMVCGTGSDVGKSQIVTGLCRLLARNGVKVAPFKAQNMALNSFVTPEGLEIGRAQGVQALAARVVPEVAMNPILLKPTSDRSSQVMVRGTPIGDLDAGTYHVRKPELLGLVLDALASLRGRYDVVLCEGAGSPAEINLLEHDIVNLRIAADGGMSAIVVGDIDRGGVFAALYGTVALLPDHYRRLVRGFVINKFRGDPALLGDGLAELERRSGVPTLGVLPWITDLALDAEDSLGLVGPRPRPHLGQRPIGESLDVACIRLPRVSNFTDVDPLGIEPGVAVRYVDHVAQLGDPDLLIVPGSKTTVEDLAWMRSNGLAEAVMRARDRVHGPVILGLCAGYQMLGTLIHDNIESGVGIVPGLSLLDVETTFLPAKCTRARRGLAFGAPAEGYEIHHGIVGRGAHSQAWIALDDAWAVEEEGAVSADRRVWGTSLHGLFESDGVRTGLLLAVAEARRRDWKPAGVSFAAVREEQFERLADLLEAHLDLEAIGLLIAGATA